MEKIKITPKQEAGNKKIAEFLKLQKCDRCEDCGSYKFLGTYWHPAEMHFYNLWDNWLMYAVDYIEELNNPKEKIPTTSYFVVQSKYDCTIIDATDDTTIVQFIGDRKEATFDVILQFIDWYEALLIKKSKRAKQK